LSSAIFEFALNTCPGMIKSKPMIKDVRMWQRMMTVSFLSGTYRKNKPSVMPLTA